MADLACKLGGASRCLRSDQPNAVVLVSVNTGGPDAAWQSPQTARPVSSSWNSSLGDAPVTGVAGLSLCGLPGDGLLLVHLGFDSPRRLQSSAAIHPSRRPIPSREPASSTSRARVQTPASPWPSSQARRDPSCGDLCERRDRLCALVTGRFKRAVREA